MPGSCCDRRGFDRLNLVFVGRWAGTTRRIMQRFTPWLQRGGLHLLDERAGGRSAPALSPCGGHGLSELRRRLRLPRRRGHALRRRRRCFRHSGPSGRLRGRVRVLQRRTPAKDLARAIQALIGDSSGPRRSALVEEGARVAEQYLPESSHAAVGRVPARALPRMTLRAALRTRLRSGARVADPPRRMAAWFEPADIDRVTESFFARGIAVGPRLGLAARRASAPTGLVPPWPRSLRRRVRRTAASSVAADRWGRSTLRRGDRRKGDPWGDVDPIRSPGYFVRRDAAAIDSASDHVIATGMLLSIAGLGGRLGARIRRGFGQTALALARLGVNVDTIDISSTFCDFVSRRLSSSRCP